MAGEDDSGTCSESYSNIPEAPTAHPLRRSPCTATKRNGVDRFTTLSNASSAHNVPPDVDAERGAGNNQNEKNFAAASRQIDRNCEYGMNMSQHNHPLFHTEGRSMDVKPGFDPGGDPKSSWINISGCENPLWEGEDDEVDSAVDKDEEVSEGLHSVKGFVPHAAHGGAHSHERESSIFTAAASAALNFLLMFGLSCSYGMIMFADDWNAQHRGLAVKMNVGSSMVAGLVAALGSSIPVAISGPDLNPVVFLGTFVSVIAQSVGEQLGLDYPDGGNVHARRLQDASFSFCMEPYSSPALEETCREYHEQLLATSVFAVSASSLAFTCIFLLLGQLQLTRYVSFVPTSVMEAFLSCVGYKVFSFALKFSNYEARQFIPAALIGVTMYFVKKAHLGNPAVVLPLLLILPLAAFHVYVVVFVGGLEQARADEMMFPEIANTDFYTLWTEGLLRVDRINIKAWVETLPDLAIMVIVVVLDCLLKISATESKLPVQYDKDRETVVAGIANALNTCMGTTVGYMQLKFNVINYGILGNVRDRRAGILYAVLSGVCFFWTVELINLLPRFFLSTMLFFAGAGFLAENLWGSRMVLSFYEWLQILVILAVFVLTGHMLYAVVLGCAITCLDILYQYSKASTIRGDFVRGGELATRERRDPLLHFHIQHLLDAWLLVVRLKGFLFFATAQSLKEVVHKELLAQLAKPEYARMRYLAFDCEMMDGLDASAAKEFRTLSREASALGITILWSHASKKLVKRLVTGNVVAASSTWFYDLQDALLYLEGRALEYLEVVQTRWQKVHPGFEEYSKLSTQWRTCEPLQAVFPRHSMDAIACSDPWEFCRRVMIARGDMVWQPRERDVGLFLVHAGAIGIFKEELVQTPTSLGRRGSQPGEKPLAVYRHGWFLNIRALSGCGRPTTYAFALEDSEVLCIDQESLLRMAREAPAMSTMIAKAVIKQQAFDEQLRTHRFLAARGQDVDFAEEERLPHHVEEQLRSIRVAARLEDLGFYRKEEAGHHGGGAVCSGGETSVQPPLAPKLMANLVKAFDQFASSHEGGHALKSERVLDALQHAGIFGTSLPEHSDGEVTQEQFVAIGRDLLMAGLSAEQRATIRNIFMRFDTDNSGFLDRGEVEALFRQHVLPCMGLEEIDHVYKAHASGETDRVHIEEFEAMMSRFVKSYELDWKLLAAAKSLAKEWAEVTPETLVRCSHAPLELAQAKEMLWVAGWNPSKEGPFLQSGFDGVMGALLMVVGALVDLPRESDKGDLSDLPSVQDESVEVQGCWHKLRDILDEPTSTPAAKVFNVFLAFAISVFISALVVEPLVSGQHPSAVTRDSRGFFYWLEMALCVLFAVEYTLRGIAAKQGGSRWRDSFATPVKLCDLVAMICGVTGWHRELMLLRSPRLFHLLRMSPWRRLFQGAFFDPAVCVMMVVWGIYLATPPEPK